MKDENININLPEGTKEVVVRHGQALPLDPPKKVIIGGLIDAPASFYQVRAGTFEEKQSHLLVDRENLTIKLIIDETNEKGTEVTGTLYLAEELKQFGINKNVYTKKQFSDLLRLNRRYFAKREQYDKIIEQLANFNYSRQIEGENKNDNKGNTRLLVDKKLKQNLESTFRLNIKLFEGQPKVTFDVEILVDVTDADTKFWLESIELNELLESKRDEIFTTQIEEFELSNIAIIEV
jgi:hypothetical protein